MVTQSPSCSHIAKVPLIQTLTMGVYFYGSISETWRSKAPSRRDRCFWKYQHEARFRL